MPSGSKIILEANPGPSGSKWVFVLLRDMRGSDKVVW